MLPFTIDKLIMDMDDDMDTISHNIIEWKHQFCVNFERELDLEVGDYSQSVFDYLFNLYFFKKAFGKVEFKRYLEEFKDINFRNSFQACNYISQKYMEFIVLYKKHFMDYFGFNHEDPLYIQRKIDKDKSGMRQKIMEYI